MSQHHLPVLSSDYHSDYCSAMNPALLNLLFTAQLAIDVNNPANVKMTVLKVENTNGGIQTDSEIQLEHTADTALVACTAGGPDNQLYYGYKMLKTETGTNVKVEGEWRSVDTRPYGVQWTFVIDSATHQSLLDQCKQDRDRFGLSKWDYVQPVNEQYENEHWYLFEMKDEKNTCGAGIVGHVPELGSFETIGDCDRSTEFLQAKQYS